MCIVTEEQKTEIRENVVNEFRNNPNLTEEDVCRLVTACSKEKTTKIGEDYVIVQYISGALEKITISEGSYEYKDITFAEAIPNYGRIEFNG